MPILDPTRLPDPAPYFEMLRRIGPANPYFDLYASKAVDDYVTALLRLVREILDPGGPSNPPPSAPAVATPEDAPGLPPHEEAYARAVLNGYLKSAYRRAWREVEAIQEEGGGRNS